MIIIILITGILITGILILTGILTLSPKNKHHRSTALTGSIGDNPFPIQIEIRTVNLRGNG